MAGQDFKKFLNFKLTNQNVLIDRQSHQKHKMLSHQNSLQDKNKFYTSQVIKHQSGTKSIRKGFKVFQVSKHFQSTLKHCLALLQSQAKFPIKSFIQNQKDEGCQKSKSLRTTKFLWLQTRILSSVQTYTQQQDKQEHIFQHNLCEFFSNYLIPKLQKFKQCFLTQKATHGRQDLSSQWIIENFTQNVLTNLNQKFRQYLTLIYNNK